MSLWGDNGVHRAAVGRVFWGISPSLCVDLWTGCPVSSLCKMELHTNDILIFQFLLVPKCPLLWEDEGYLWSCLMLKNFHEDRGSEQNQFRKQEDYFRCRQGEQAPRQELSGKTCWHGCGGGVLFLGIT